MKRKILAYILMSPLIMVCLGTLYILISEAPEMTLGAFFGIFVGSLFCIGLEILTKKDK